MNVALMVMALSSFSVAAMAAETTAVAVNSTPPVEEYTYATHLDIAKVVSMSDACSPLMRADRNTTTLTPTETAERISMVCPRASRR